MPEQLRPATLAEGISACKGCELYREAEHGVAGNGPVPARLMVVGEQPGDREDREGRPFVGPAGRLLDALLEEAGVDRDETWVTNAVKHFRWRSGAHGKRLHQGPSRVHVAACGPWLLAEVDMVRPTGLVMLGATAGSALYGSSFRVGTSRGRPLQWPEEVGGRRTRWTPDWVVATAHPSSVLRSRDRDRDRAALLDDLRVVAGLLD